MPMLLLNVSAGSAPTGPSKEALGVDSLKTLRKLRKPRESSCFAACDAPRVQALPIVWRWALCIAAQRWSRLNH